MRHCLIQTTSPSYKPQRAEKRISCALMMLISTNQRFFHTVLRVELRYAKNLLFFCG
jgi:hypothetical protein